MTRAIIEPTSHVPSVLRAARSLVCSGQPEQALRVLSHGLRSVETFDPAHALSLTILLNLGRRRDAEKAFNTALPSRGRPRMRSRHLPSLLVGSTATNSPIRSIGKPLSCPQTMRGTGITWRRAPEI